MTRRVRFCMHPASPARERRAAGLRRCTTASPGRANAGECTTATSTCRDSSHATASTTTIFPARSPRRRPARLRATGAPFNSVGLNLYRDGRDSVAPHNDHLYEIAAGYPIALVSLGATRLMTIRSKSKPRRIFDLDLEAGSLLLMSYETQRHYDHGIPKTRATTGPRISVALRVRPQ